MNLNVVIGQIKALVPFFNGNVAGAAAWAMGTDSQVWLPLPAAYVVPLEGDCTENADLGASIYLTLTERINVIVQLDNSTDRRGQSATNAYEPVKAALLAALLGWRPNSTLDNPGVVVPGPGVDVSARGLMLVGHGLVNLDVARLFYRWTWELQSIITDADGWQRPSVPFTSVQVNTGVPDTEPFTVPLPQLAT